jgi:hypothetical protein
MRKDLGIAWMTVLLFVFGALLFASKFDPRVVDGPQRVINDVGNVIANASYDGCTQLLADDVCGQLVYNW